MGADTLVILDGFKIGMFVFFMAKGLTWAWLHFKMLARG